VNDVLLSAPTKVIGGPAAGRVYVYSGKTGALLFTHDGEPGDLLGNGIEAAGDVDGDGHADVIAGAPGAHGGRGRALVLSGKDGSVLRAFEGEAPGDGFGRKVSGAGDVDGDGHADVLVGADLCDSFGADAGRAYLFSGKDGSVLLSLDGENAGDKFGVSLCGVTTGGATLIAAGAADAGANHGGRVYLFRWKKGEVELLYTIEPEPTSVSLGQMFLSFPGDVDGDGTIDLYASDWMDATRGPTTGRVYVYSGREEKRLFALTGEHAGDGFGIGTAEVGDVDGDGHADLLIGARQNSPRARPSGGKCYTLLRQGRLAARVVDLHRRERDLRLRHDRHGRRRRRRRDRLPDHERLERNPGQANRPRVPARGQKTRPREVAPGRERQSGTRADRAPVAESTLRPEDARGSHVHQRRRLDAQPGSGAPGFRPALRIRARRRVRALAGGIPAALPGCARGDRRGAPAAHGQPRPARWPEAACTRQREPAAAARYVYLAVDRRMRPVALKIPVACAPKTGAPLRFQREVEVTCSTTRGRAVYEATEGTRPYLAMRYVDGVDLARQIAEQKAEPRPDALVFPRNAVALARLLHVFERAARALNAAHESGVLHRDVKPGNIIVRGNGEPVIVDFGLARAEDEVAGLTRTDDVLGTPAYMSPEMIESGHSAVDRRADIYALGVSLYECLTLERPFGADSRGRPTTAFGGKAQDRASGTEIGDDLRAKAQVRRGTRRTRRTNGALTSPGICAACAAGHPCAAGDSRRLKRWASAIRVATAVVPCSGRSRST
jgi:hypothetical protein